MRRRGRSKSTDCRSLYSASPRSELSIVDEVRAYDAPPYKVPAVSTKKREKAIEHETPSQTASDFVNKHEKAFKDEAQSPIASSLASEESDQAINELPMPTIADLVIEESEETVDEAPLPTVADLVIKESDETVDQGQSPIAGSLVAEESDEAEDEAPLPTVAYLVIQDSEETVYEAPLDSPCGQGKQNDPAVLEDELLSQAASDIFSENQEVITNAVTSTEPKLERDKMSSLKDACFESVIHDALTSDRASPIEDVQDDTRGPSASTMISEEAYSEVAAEDSFCLGSDFDDGDKSAAVDAVFNGDLFRSPSGGFQPPTLFTAASTKLDSENVEDVFDVMEEAKWLEDDADSVDQRLHSHQLNDILGSFTDSEFGDEYAQMLLEKHRGTPFKEESMNNLPTNTKEFSVRYPMQQIPVKKETDEKPKLFTKCDSSKLVKADGSFQIRGHGLLWMLGGNLLAGVVGAAIATAG